MTAEEFEGLRDGEVIEARLRGKWARVTVVGFDWFSVAGRVEIGLVHVRRVGRNASGKLFGVWRKTLYDLRLPADPQPANVYADWLEEHGEPEAARKLREAFPCPPAAPPLP